MSLTAGEVSALLPTLLPQTATVYGYTAATGAYETVLRAELPCRVQHVGGGQSQGQRAELLALRSILFDPDYVMADDVQLAIEGTRYDPLEGTFRALRAGAVVVRAVDAIVAKAET